MSPPSRAAGTAPQADRWQRREVLFVVVVAVAVGWSRGLLWPKYLADWDAVAFADALRSFDVTCNRPHPPGFPLFILLGRLAALLIDDPARALSLVSTAATVAATPLLYALGRRWLNPTWARVWVLWWASHPLLWYYGALQLTYPLEAFTTLGLLLFWTRQDEAGGGSGALAGGLFGLALGVRMSTLAVLGLVFGARWLRRGVRWKAASLAGLVVGVLVWMLPAAWLSGGWGAYRTASRYTGEGFFVSESALSGNWAGVVRHLVDLGAALREVMGPGGLELALAVVGAVWLWRRRPRGQAVGDGALWIVGTMAYLVLFHMGQWGYLIAVLPPLGLLAIGACRAVLRPWEGQPLGWGRWGAPLVAALFVTWHGALFLGATGRASRFAIRQNDEVWDRYTRLVREHFDPADTVLYCFGVYRQVAWYLPEYRCLITTLLYRNPDQFPIASQNAHWSLQRDIQPARWFYPGHFTPHPERLPDGTRHLVMFDSVTWVYGPPPPVMYPVGPRGELQAIDLTGPTELVYAFGRWSLRPVGSSGRSGTAGSEPVTAGERDRR